MRSKASYYATFEQDTKGVWFARLRKSPEKRMNTARLLAHIAKLRDADEWDEAQKMMTVYLHLRKLNGHLDLRYFRDE